MARTWMPWTMLTALCALPSCGQTSRDAGGSGGAANAAGASALAGMTAAAGGGLEPPSTNCLYPARIPSQQPAKIDVADYRLSDAFPIGVQPEVWGGLHATFDQNGDSVSDLIYLDRSAAAPQFRLLLSAPPPNVLDYEPRACPELEQLPVGRLFLRDLDGDRAPDFILGTETAVLAYVNASSGLRKVFEFTWPEPHVRAALINVGVADLDEDKLPDLVFSYDRVTDEAKLMFETGWRAFKQQPDAAGRPAGMGGFEPAGSNATLVDAVNTLDSALSGYVAVGRFKSTGPPGIFSTVTRLQPGVLGQLSHASGGARQVNTADEGAEAGWQALALQGPEHERVALVGSSSLQVYDLEPEPARLVMAEPLVFDSYLTHELGGGSEQPRHWFWDVDHDGDSDFFELDASGSKLALRVNLANDGFAPPQILEAGSRNLAESPLLTVGPSTAVLSHVFGEVPEVRTLMAGQ